MDSTFMNATMGNRIDIAQIKLPGNIEDLLKLEKLSLQDRSVGCLLSVMLGDILGACVEGWGADQIECVIGEGTNSNYSMPTEFNGKKIFSESDFLQKRFSYGHLQSWTPIWNV